MVDGGASSLDEAVAVDTGTGQFQVQVATAGIAFFSDEPVSAGGLGSGPTPYQLLASALASCTTMTLRLYANNKKWPVDAIRTSVGHRRQTGSQPIDLFVRRISIVGKVDAGQRARLMEIADRCPVHRTLTATARVETLAGDAPVPAARSTNHAVDMEALISVGRGSFDFTQ